MAGYHFRSFGGWRRRISRVPGGPCAFVIKDEICYNPTLKNKGEDMIVKPGIVVLIAALMMGCGAAKEKRNLKSFIEEYIHTREEFAKQLNSTFTKGEYATLQKKENNEIEKLLRKYNTTTSSNEAELLKSKLLVKIGKYDEAEKKIDPLIHSHFHLINDARLVKAQILIYRGKPTEALTILKEVEGKIKPGPELLSLYLYFALYSYDQNILKEYAQKFLGSPSIPGELTAYKTDIYRRLAAAAIRDNDLDRARELLEKGISEVSKTSKRTQMEAELAQLALIGISAPDIFAETWFNSSPVTLDSLKGRVVVLDFWAPWCASCRAAIPVLNKLYEQYKDNGLIIIGLTRLYGKYSDETGDKGPVSKNEEIDLINRFLVRHNVVYPSAAAVENVNTGNYRVKSIPTLVFINKKGEIDCINVGVGPEQFIESKIKKLLEVNEWKK
jgi:thiol-disulfide isomerase/thioredoxin